MKALLVGYEVVPDYKNSRGEEKKGGFKLYFVSEEAFTRSAINEKLCSGYCPLKNNYWVGRESKMIDSRALLEMALPAHCDLDFNYQGYLDSIKFKK